jgi:ribonucleoside-diphosphate reductase alpha chain
MCGQAYLSSAEIAQEMGTFDGYEENREPMLEVIRKHRAAINGINRNRVPEELIEAADDVWRKAFVVGHDFGYRNSQVTVLAPTGTIGFMMDCDTTGIEPDIALVKYKKLVDGGLLRIVNNTVPEALERLGYEEDEVREIVDYVDEHGTIEGAPHLAEEHLPVFDCAFKPEGGKRTIHYMGHLRMMAATQPFLSGAISKTVNVPNEVSAEEIMQAYIEGWKLGLKAIAIYRDGSKRLQPLNTGRDRKEGEKSTDRLLAPPEPHRVRLPDERQAVTHKFSVAGHEGYITVGLYPNGKPGEMFISMAKEGSVVSGLMDSFATAVSIMLQYGVPLKVLVSKFSHMRFEPSGMTTNPDIPMAKSVMDYIFRWLDHKFGDAARQAGQTVEEEVVEKAAAEAAPAMKAMAAAAGAIRERENRIFESQADSPPCPECGAVTVRNGACYKCNNCGATTGCS